MASVSKCYSFRLDMHNADLYESSNGLQRRDAAAVVAEFVPRLSWAEDELVLDIGCGSGDVTHDILMPAIANVSARNKKMAKAGKIKVVGVDVSTEMIKHARSKFGATSTASFAQLDISHELPNNKVMRTFDKIFSFYCLHWVKEQSVALRNVHRLLSDDRGEAVFLFLASNPLFTAYRRLAKRPKWSAFMADVERFVPFHQDDTDPAATFSQQLVTAGFSVESCEARHMSFVFPNANLLVAALKAVNPFLSRVPSDEQSAFMFDLLSELKGLRTPGMDQGQAEARYTLLVAHARKASAEEERNDLDN